MQATLSAFLLGSAVVIVAHPTDDFIRTAVALCLALLPTSFRFVVEGYRDDKTLMWMGVSGILVTIVLVRLSKLQALCCLHQHELDQRTEDVTSAAIALSLAKSRFFASVGHDLRQSVHAVGLCLDPLVKLGKAARDEPTRRASENIQLSWRALDDLLSQLLDLTRLDSGVVEADLQSIEAAPLIRKLIAQLSVVAELADVRVVALVKANCFVIADHMMLRRAISNLLDNAIRFAPRGSTVVVALRNSPAAWRLQVRDAGIGIAKEAQSRIFDEYVQLESDVRNPGKGVGLGLAITKRLVLLMKGNIAVRSAPGRGCCMTVTLPRALEPQKSMNHFAQLNEKQPCST